MTVLGIGELATPSSVSDFRLLRSQFHLAGLCVGPENLSISYSFQSLPLHVCLSSLMLLLPTMFLACCIVFFEETGHTVFLEEAVGMVFLEGAPKQGA